MYFKRKTVSFRINYECTKNIMQCWSEIALHLLIKEIGLSFKTYGACRPNEESA